MSMLYVKDDIQHFLLCNNFSLYEIHYLVFLAFFFFVNVQEKS